MQERDLPRGWTIWHDRPDDIVVLTFRPDVFDGSSYPAECLPTIAIKPERTRGGRGRPQSPGRASMWCAELTVEPNVVIDRTREPDRELAIESGLELARAFSGGSIDYRDGYVDPDNAYLDRLDELVGSEE